MPIIEGEVQGFEESKGGKPKIKIAGGWYYLGNTVMDVAYGDRVSIEWTSWSPPDNAAIKLRMIQGWGLVNKSAPPVQPASPPVAQPTPQPAPQPAAPPQPQPSPPVAPPVTHHYPAPPPEAPQSTQASPEAQRYAEQAAYRGGNTPAANLQPQKTKGLRAYEDLPREGIEGDPIHDADQLRLISNVMASLVNVGQVKTRGEACRWIFALSCAVRGIRFAESEIPF